VWYCKLLLLFEIESRTDDGIERHKCVFVSVLEEFTGDKKPGLNLHMYYLVTYSTYVTYLQFKL
jgi:hypothetical protein